MKNKLSSFISSYSNDYRYQLHTALGLSLLVFLIGWFEGDVLRFIKESLLGFLFATFLCTFVAYWVGFIIEGLQKRIFGALMDEFDEWSTALGGFLAPFILLWDVLRPIAVLISAIYLIGVLIYCMYELYKADKLPLISKWISIAEFNDWCDFHKSEELLIPNVEKLFKHKGESNGKIKYSYRNFFLNYELSTNKWKLYYRKGKILVNHGVVRTTDELSNLVDKLE